MSEDTIEEEFFILSIELHSAGEQISQIELPSPYGMNITLSNPRLHAVIADYPLGGSKRGEMRFDVESHPKRGFRFVRQSTGKPKTETYGGKAAIVDGSNGRTYLIQLAGAYNFINVRRADFMSDNEVTGTNAVFEDHADYAALKALIDEANK